jgi:hypothetical protein
MHFRQVGCSAQVSCQARLLGVSRRIQLIICSQGDAIQHSLVGIGIFIAVTLIAQTRPGYAAVVDIFQPDEERGVMIF